MIEKTRDSEVDVIRSVEGLATRALEDFFEGWENKPTAETLKQLLFEAPFKAIALDRRNASVVGFTYAVSDKMISAYIPLLEVRSEHRGRGIGARLVRDLLEQCEGLYMVDACCDEELTPFYSALGFQKGGAGMIRRNYRAQAGLFK